MKNDRSLLTPFRTLLLIIVLSLACGACSDLLEVEPQTVLAEEKAYQTLADADAAVLGVYGKFMQLAESYVIMNELRADLLDVTPQANHYLRALNTHSATDDNPYIDPRPFYEVILNCNDVLKHFDEMKASFKLDEKNYHQRYADIAALRSWVYLQLGIHYGTVPYITEPLETVDDALDPANYPMTTLDELVDKLIAFMEALPYKDTYSEDISLYTTVDGYSTREFPINKNMMLGDLYLWADEYAKAAFYYRAVMDPFESDFYVYKVKWGSPTDNNDLVVGYLRYREQDINALVNNNSQGWRSIFARGQDDLFYWEWIWSLPFESNFAPKNPFIDLFAKSGGDYLLKPSQEVMDQWNAQVQYNDFPYDARRIFSAGSNEAQPQAMKYLYYFDPLDPFQKDGRWFLMRAAGLHLRFAEAANRDGRQKLAWAFLNEGIRATFDSDPANTDQTYKQATFDTYPYNFDARYGTYPYFRGNWHQHTGIRGRAYVYPLQMDPTVTTPQDSTLFIEEKLIDEAALELAFEGYRWADLLRIAKRRNDPAFLADRVYQKLLKGNHPEAAAVREKLMNPEAWYLPFK